MSTLLKLNMLTLIVISMLLLSVYGQQNKHICPIIKTVICVKDVLLDIVNAAKEIKSIADKIEQHIFQRESISYSLNESVIRLEHTIRSNLPTFKYHKQFMQFYNIDKDYFIHLIKEENYAFSFLYNSINNILEMENVFRSPTEKSFKNISNILRKNILCNYRNILHVYSEVWIDLDKISGLQIRNGTSFVHNTYSIITTRLLRRWIEHTDYTINNFEKKLF